MWLLALYTEFLPTLQVELSLTCTCMDSETIAQRTGQKDKELSLHRNVHLSAHTILDYYILHRIKRKIICVQGRVVKELQSA